MERAFLARNLIAVTGGKYDDVNLECIRKQMRFEGGIRYIEIELAENMLDDEMSDDEKRACQRKLFEVCIEYLNDYADYCVFDVSGIEKIYGNHGLKRDSTPENRARVQVSGGNAVFRGGDFRLRGI